MDEREAVEALERLGLTNYEAKVFIALQRLGSGSARDVAEESDVPRPQVYSTAESLEARGLVDVQRSDPIRYRPVELEEAKTRLRNRFERTQETAFEYIERVRTEGSGDEEREDIWTITGAETIDARIRHLVRGADREVLVGIPSVSMVRSETAAALREAATADVSVTVISHDSAVRDRFDDAEGIDVVEPAIEDPGGTTGRLLVVDGDTVLLSVFGGENAHGASETAIWSGETQFARVLIGLIRSYLRA